MTGSLARVVPACCCSRRVCCPRSSRIRSRTGCASRRPTPTCGPGSTRSRCGPGCGRPSQPTLDDDGVIRHNGLWASLPPVEARITRLLLDRLGAVVSRESLVARRLARRRARAQRPRRPRAAPAPAAGSGRPGHPHGALAGLPAGADHARAGPRSLTRSEARGERPDGHRRGPRPHPRRPGRGQGGSRDLRARRRAGGRRRDPRRHHDRAVRCSTSSARTRCCGSSASSGVILLLLEVGLEMDLGELGAVGRASHVRRRRRRRRAVRPRLRRPGWRSAWTATRRCSSARR